MIPSLTIHPRDPSRAPSLLTGTSWAPALRFQITAMGTVLVTALLCAGLVERGGGHAAATWGWAAVWVLAAVALATRAPVRSLRTTVGSPLLAGGLTLILAVVVDQVLPVIDSMPTLLVLLAALSAVAALLGCLLTVGCRPRGVALVPEHPGDPRTPIPQRGSRLLSVQVGPAIMRDPEALTRVLMLSVDQVDAEYVVLCPGIDPATASVLGWELRARGVSVRMPLDGIPVRGSRLSTVTATGSTQLVMAPPSQPVQVRVLKRAQDVLGALLLLALLSPLLVAVALLIRRDDPGPVLFQQERVGLDGRTFRIWKFRTMVVDADSRLAALLRDQGREGTPLFKVEDDPRITRPGRVLRRYSIDELPQLLNVLDGSMSLVGPRPQRPAEVALYTGTAAHRLGVRPGMTGLWQVSGRSNLGWQKAQELDVFYAHNWSPVLDAAIIVRTVRAVLAADGAV